MECLASATLLCETISDLSIYRFDDARLNNQVFHAILSRQGGVSSSPFASLNLSSSVGDDPTTVEENRKRAYSALGINRERLARCAQVSGNSVFVVDRATVKMRPVADALVSTTPGLTLGMTFADCLPIIIVDPKLPAVALVHAGWRGTISMIAVHAWSVLKTLGAQSASTLACIGPAIHSCCYEVGKEVANLVLRIGHAGKRSIEERSGAFYLDLPRLNKELLNDAGIEVIDSGICTACHSDRFFSHRAEAGKTGRFAVYAGVTS